MNNPNQSLPRKSSPLAVLATVALLASCTIDTANNADTASKALAGSGPVRQATTISLASAPLAKAAPVQNPILFVTQVPTDGDPYASRMSAFANHIPTMAALPRGGDMMIRYADGSLRNLTKEAGYGVEGLQDARAIAVREPAVHWDGAKAIFSMLVGGPAARYDHPTSKWQLYEVTGLGKGQRAVITKVAGQPTAYNNVSPLYSSDDRILFTSDRPRGGEAHLFPQLDEYESVATITGIYRLDPATGQLRILNHTPSGAFSPSIDSYGRLIFTRWDHLQRDQQADAGTYNATNYASEAANATNVGLKPEVFPESRLGMNSNYGAVNGFTYNLFSPWQMNQDGTEELSLNHIGRQELSFGYLTKSFATDSALSENNNYASYIANKKRIVNATGLFHVREDPTNPGIYFAVYTREFATATSGQIVRMTGAPNLNAEQMTIVDASPAEVSNSLAGGRFRDPLPTRGGQMVAAYTTSPVFQGGVQMRLHQLDTNAAGMFVAGNALTPGINKTISWWSPDSMREFSGALWEIEPAEVVARPRPPNPTSALEAPEKSVFDKELVNEATLRDWLKTNNLALIVTRNQTSRDRGDRQQPYNLQVPSGTRTTSGSGRVYEIAHYQILQADLVRGYPSSDVRRSKGRRVLAQPMTVTRNPATSGPVGSVKIAADGSTAAFVPASRALTWQTTDAGGSPIVRERVWVTLQPGEIRTCAGCHGENSRNQAGLPSPVNEPEALRQLLRHWKASSLPVRVNGSQPRVPGGG